MSFINIKFLFKIYELLIFGFFPVENHDMLLYFYEHGYWLWLF